MFKIIKQKYDLALERRKYVLRLFWITLKMAIKFKRLIARRGGGMHRKFKNYIKYSFNITALFFTSRVEIALRTAPYESKSIYFMRAVTGKIINLFNDPNLSKNIKEELAVYSKVFK